MTHSLGRGSHQKEPRLGALGSDRGGVRVRIAGSGLYYEEQGEGVPILLIHPGRRDRVELAARRRRPRQGLRRRSWWASAPR